MSVRSLCPNKYKRMTVDSRSTNDWNALFEFVDTVFHTSLVSRYYSPLLMVITDIFVIAVWYGIWIVLTIIKIYVYIF